MIPEPPSTTARAPSLRRTTGPTPGDRMHLSDAVNYDENALVDDGTCFQDPCPLCFGDVNGDGFVGVADVLSVLSAFGTGC